MCVWAAGRLDWGRSWVALLAVVRHNSRHHLAKSPLRPVRGRPKHRQTASTILWRVHQVENLAGEGSFFVSSFFLPPSSIPTKPGRAGVSYFGRTEGRDLPDYTWPIPSHQNESISA